MTLAIVSPGYPAATGGVTDHTARLVRNWGAAGAETRVLGWCDENPRRIAGRWRAQGVGGILIQYVPFLYGRRGLSRFPRGLATAARAAGLRVGVFVHEPWVPRTRVPWLLLSPLQRRQLLRLVEACHVACTPVPAWRARLGDQTHLLYVGSTLGEPAASVRSEPPLPAPVVFSPFAAGLRWDWIAAAARAIGSTPGLTVIGADWDAARRHAIVRRWADPAWDWRGYLGPPAALALLSRARVVLAPFVDGLTGRRTSAFAAASVGARLISSRGPLFDPAFDDAPFGLANSEAEFRDLAANWFREPPSPADRERRAHWYRQRLAPADLDRTLLGLLRGT
ncbi:MAG: hypothetical protein HYV20_12875 [Gemmatimonadetes bacterium]|nr:hypothetical protein [Gemmatimonadota bacterium]